MSFPPVTNLYYSYTQMPMEKHSGLFSMMVQYTYCKLVFVCHQKTDFRGASDLCDCVCVCVCVFHSNQNCDHSYEPEEA